MREKVELYICNEGKGGACRDSGVTYKINCLCEKKINRKRIEVDSIKGKQTGTYFPELASIRETWIVAEKVLLCGNTVWRSTSPFLKSLR